MADKENTIDFSYREILSRINMGSINDMIVIEGVVGVGKSSLMHILGEKGYVKFEEPVVDNPILDKFYHDRTRYSFPLQVFFLNKRFEHIKKTDDVTHAVMDRSIYGDAIFARMLNLNQEMSDEEFQIYQELLENMLDHVRAPKLMIYLEVSVDEAMRRIAKRGRDYEQIVERAYWEDLNREYTSYFEDYELSPVLRINVDNLDFENNEADRLYVMKRIDQALEAIEK